MKFEYDGKKLSYNNKRSETSPNAPCRGKSLGAFFMYLGICAVIGLFWRLGNYFLGSGHAKDELSVMRVPVADLSKESVLQPSEPKVTKARAEKGVVAMRDALDYLTPSEAEIMQLYAHVVTSPVVAENRQYSSRLANIPLVYDSTNDIVNACAAKYVDDGEEKFCTLVFGGAARYARLVGLAAAAEEAGVKDALKTLMEKMPRGMCSRCSPSDAVGVIEECGLVAALADSATMQKAVSNSSGTLIGVLAHEAGHHVFGHLLDGGAKTNLEVERNREREADSFASSVISTSAFGEHIFAGTLFWHYAVAVQSDGDTDAGRSHPLSKERFLNFVRANPDKAAAMGVSSDVLRGESE